MKQAVRTFVAVEIDKKIRSAAADLIERLQGVGADVKWVDPENMHLTLKFLGEVPLSETAAVCRSVARGAAKVDPFEMEICGAGAFPSASQPRTLWMGAGDGESEMIELHRHIERALAKLGYRKENRRFHPHLTLGRVRRGGPAVVELGAQLQEQADFVAGKISVSRVVVFSSQLRPSGPIYEPLGHARLGGGG